MKVTEPPNQPSLTIGERIAAFRENFDAWRDNMRKDPAAFFEPQPVRIALWAFGALLVLLLVKLGISIFAPTKAGTNFEEATAEASIMVACTNRGCNKSYMANPPKDFKNWPMTCSTCANQSVYRASLCKSCRAWYARPPGSAPGCPFCEEREQKAKADADAKKKPTTRSSDKHDRDDDW